MSPTVHMRSGRTAIVVAATSVAGAVLLASPVTPAVQFPDITAASGIAFRHAASKTPVKFLPETMGGGVALLDYDGDGKLDVFFTNGARIDERMTSKRQPDKTDSAFWNRLYRNLGDGTFADVTERAGLAGRRYDFGAAVGDDDNDGDVDLYVTGYGGNTLYRNNGDGTFTDVTARAGVGAGGWSSSAGFVDYDHDGHLDLFVARYLDWSWEDNIVCAEAGGPERSYCHPRHFAPIASVLFRNNGNGTFTDVSEVSGIAAHPGKALGVAFNDVDRDGRIDIFVANDSMRQFLFRNRGDGTFAEIGLEAGVAYDEDGRSFAGMGTDVEDYDNDSRPDIVVTTLSHERYALFRNTGDGRFAYATHTSGVGAATQRFSGWGTRLLDFDNDGDKDLFAAQGHVMDTLTKARNGVDYLQAPIMLRNDDGRFTDVSARLGPAFAHPKAGRGAAIGDLDNDGDLDIVVTNLDDAPSILRNDGGNMQAWLLVTLRGTRSNRSGLGALVTVVDDRGRTQVRTATTASSYQSASDSRVHFGVGTARLIRRLEVRWPSGIIQVVSSVATSQALILTEPARAGRARGIRRDEVAARRRPARRAGPTVVRTARLRSVGRARRARRSPSVRRAPDESGAYTMSTAQPR